MERVLGFAWLEALGVMLTAASPLVGQSPSPISWTGVMRGERGSTQPIRYSVPDDPQNTTFAIIRGRDTIAVTDVRFDGSTLSFRSALESGAACRLTAVPGRGYSGSCDLAGGSAVTLTMIPPVPGMILPGHELTLAREAAPGHLADQASVYVLRSSGYAELVHGTISFVCYVWRPRGVDFWPICMRRDAADALLPVEQLRSGLRAAGLSERVIADSVDSAYRTGRFRSPIGGSVGYMLSAHAWTAEEGTNYPMTLPPHLHIYLPNITNAALGIDLSRRNLMRVEREGWPDASLIVLATGIDHQ
jgi:hypothetical protein